MVDGITQSIGKHVQTIRSESNDSNKPPEKNPKGGDGGVVIGNNSESGELPKINSVNSVYYTDPELKLPEGSEDVMFPNFVMLLLAIQKIVEQFLIEQMVILQQIRRDEYINTFKLIDQKIKYSENFAQQQYDNAKDAQQQKRNAAIVSISAATAGVVMAASAARSSSNMNNTQSLDKKATKMSDTPTRQAEVDESLADANINMNKEQITQQLSPQDAATVSNEELRIKVQQKAVSNSYTDSKNSYVENPEERLFSKSPAKQLRDQLKQLELENLPREEKLNQFNNQIQTHNSNYENRTAVTDTTFTGDGKQALTDAQLIGPDGKILFINENSANGSVTVMIPQMSPDNTSLQSFDVVTFSPQAAGADPKYLATVTNVVPSNDSQAGLLRDYNSHKADNIEALKNSGAINKLGEVVKNGSVGMAGPPTVAYDLNEVRGYSTTLTENKQNGARLTVEAHKEGAVSDHLKGLVSKDFNVSPMRNSSPVRKAVDTALSKATTDINLLRQYSDSLNQVTSGAAALLESQAQGYQNNNIVTEARKNQMDNTLDKSINVSTTISEGIRTDIAGFRESMRKMIEQAQQALLSATARRQ